MEHSPGCRFFVVVGGMGQFLDSLMLESTGEFRSGRPVREVMHRFRYVYGDHLAGGMVDVYDGFRSDLTSTPWWLWWIMPAWLGEESSLLHDFMYTVQTMDRAMADAIFRHSLKDCNVDMVRRWLMWLGVRCFGWLRYAQRDPYGKKKEARESKALNGETKRWEL